MRTSRISAGSKRYASHARPAARCNGSYPRFALGYWNSQRHARICFERTSEIGLRVSVGAQPIHIVAQFITEAIVLCLLGSLFGLVIGKLGTLLLNELVDWDVKMSYEKLLSSLLWLRHLRALIFGLYPAYRASQLSPLAAMQKS